MTTPEFLPEPPGCDEITPYDEAHLVTYLRLLDAHAEGADWQEVVRIVFGMVSDTDWPRAKHMYDSHLSRAQWICESGYRHLRCK